MRFEEGRFQPLRERLLAGGIAPRRVKRYLAELDDHLAELTAQERQAGYGPDEAAARARAVLGSDDDLAQSWLANPRLKSLTARAPWAVLPVAIALFVVIGFAIWILAWVATAYAGGVIGGQGRTVPSWFAAFSHLIPPVANFLVPPLSMIALAVLAHRRRLNAFWLFIPALVLLSVGLRLSIAVAPHSLSVGFGFAAPSAFFGKQHADFPFSPPVVALHVLLILAPAFWLTVWRHGRTKPN